MEGRRGRKEGLTKRRKMGSFALEHLHRANTPFSLVNAYPPNERQRNRKSQSTERNIQREKNPREKRKNLVSLSRFFRERERKTRQEAWEYIEAKRVFFHRKKKNKNKTRSRHQNENNKTELGKPFFKRSHSTKTNFMHQLCSFHCNPD